MTAIDFSQFKTSSPQDVAVEMSEISDSSVVAANAQISSIHDCALSLSDQFFSDFKELFSKNRENGEYPIIPLPNIRMSQTKNSQTLSIAWGIKNPWETYVDPIKKPRSGFSYTEEKMKKYCQAPYLELVMSYEMKFTELRILYRRIIKFRIAANELNKPYSQIDTSGE